MATRLGRRAMADGLRLHGPWGEHPGHPLASWKYEVANDDTRLGYWAWVAAREDRAEARTGTARPH
jgi:hypothetical protein